MKSVIKELDEVSNDLDRILSWLDDIRAAVDDADDDLADIQDLLSEEQPDERGKVKVDKDEMERIIKRMSSKLV